MKPFDTSAQLAFLALALGAYGVGRVALRLVTALTEWEPRTGFGRALWGIVPAAPFALAFAVAVTLAVWERLGRPRGKE